MSPGRLKRRSGTVRTMKHTARNCYPLAVNSEGQAPLEIQLLPAGHMRGRDGREFNNSDPTGILAAFQRYGGPMAIDYEHASEIKQGEEIPAAGWITAMEDRDGEIWGKVGWTNRAAKMISGREYRFLSPVFYHDKALNILAIKSAGLTNQPNLIMQALNKADQSQSTPDIGMETVMDKTARIALCKSLGLTDEASDQAILAAVTQLQDDKKIALNKAETPDATLFVPRADYDQLKGNLETAQNKIDTIEGQKAEAVIDQAIKDGKVAPSSKDYHLAACKQDGGLEAFKAMVAASPSINDGGKDTTKNPEGGQIALNKDQRKILQGLGHDPDDADLVKDLKAEGVI